MNPLPTWIAGLACLLAVLPAHSTVLTNSITGSVSDGKLTIPYRLFQPQLDSPVEKVPLVLYLAGAGDRGTDNVSQTYWMSNLQQETLSGQYAAYVLAPQLDGLDNWDSPNRKPSETETLTMTALQEAMQDPNVDLSRIYITGVSLGSLGVFDMLRLYPKLFAAGVPMSYGGKTKWASKMKKIPLWAFQGSKDPYVPVSWMRNMIAALRKVGGHPIYTEIPGGGHYIWPDIYADPSLYEWWFAQHTSVIAHPAAVRATTAGPSGLPAPALADVTAPLTEPRASSGAAVPDAVSIAVPEPAGIALLILGGSLLLGRRHTPGPPGRR